MRGSGIAESEEAQEASAQLEVALPFPTRRPSEDQFRINVTTLEQFDAADCNRVRATSSTLLFDALPRSVPTTTARSSSTE